MSAAAHLLVDIAEGAAGSPSRERAADHRDAGNTAWRREMERAQLQSWLRPSSPRATDSHMQAAGRSMPWRQDFDGPVETGAETEIATPHRAADLHVSAGSITRKPTPEASEGSNSNTAVASQSSADVDQASRAHEGGPKFTRRPTGSGLVPGEPGGSESRRASSALPGPAGASSSTAGAAATRRESVRMVIHMTNAHSANVWLGVDARLVVHAALLATEVRRLLRDNGLEMMCVVCNGTRVAPAGGAVDMDQRFVPMACAHDSSERQTERASL